MDVKILGFAAAVAGTLFTSSPAAAQTIEEPARAALVEVALDCREFAVATASPAPGAAVPRAQPFIDACDRSLRRAALLPSSQRQGDPFLVPVADAFSESRRWWTQVIVGTDGPVERLNAADALIAALDALDGVLRR
jgi:hypothetical protein